MVVLFLDLILGWYILSVIASLKDFFLKKIRVGMFFPSIKIPARRKRAPLNAFLK